jgi:hypothetical protein
MCVMFKEMQMQPIKLQQDGHASYPTHELLYSTSSTVCPQRRYLIVIESTLQYCLNFKSNKIIDNQFYLFDKGCQ